MVDKSILFHRINQLPEQAFFLLGPRSTGKTTWLKHELPEAVWISLLEESKFQQYLRDPGQFRREIRSSSPGRWIVVDEIQRLPQLLNEVHADIEERGTRFALCGSSARKLKRAGVNLLAGRALLRTMYPLVASEIGTPFHLGKALQFGTLPHIWQMILATHSSQDNLTDQIRDRLEAYSHFYLKEEIQAEALVRNLPAFARFLPVSALFHAQVLEISSLARDAGISRTTVEDYIQIVEDTLLAYRLPAFSRRLKVKQTSKPKFYWVDSGIVRILRGNLRPPAPEERGALFEGFVLMSLKAYHSRTRLFDQISYWASSSNRAIEVDFVLEKDGQYIGVEVKSSERVRAEDFKGLRSLNESISLQRKIVVYPELSAPQKTEDQIEVMSFQGFDKILEQKTLWNG